MPLHPGRPLRRAALLATWSATLALLAGCGDAVDQGEAPPSSEAASTRTPSPVPSLPSPDPSTPSSPPEPTGQILYREDSAEWGTDHVLSDRGTGGLVVNDIRTGPHDGFDRVVLDLDGQGVPGWYVTYTDEPTLDGSGIVAEMEGGAFLDVFISWTLYPMDTSAQTYAGPVLLDGDGTAVVSQVRFVGSWEGDTQVLISLEGAEQRPFRVFALDDPARVVIDVATDEQTQHLSLRR